MSAECWVHFSVEPAGWYSRSERKLSVSEKKTDVTTDCTKPRRYRSLNQEVTFRVLVTALTVNTQFHSQLLHMLTEVTVYKLSECLLNQYHLSCRFSYFQLAASAMKCVTVDIFGCLPACIIMNFILHTFHFSICVSLEHSSCNLLNPLCLLWSN